MVASVAVRGRTWRSRAAETWIGRMPHASQAAAGLLALHVVVAATSALWTPYSPFTLSVGPPLSTPSTAHWFGTDDLGRDIFSRVIAGERPVLVTAVAATGLALVIGTFVGIVSGYVRGFLDEGAMRIVDVLNSIPPLVVALLVISALGGTTYVMIMTVGLLYAPRVARVVRAAALTVTTDDFVLAAKARGESVLSITFRELLPNIVGVALVEFGIRMSYTITFIGALNLLGFGASPPSPSWGLMISAGRNFLATAPWIALAPAIAMASLVIAINLFTDGFARILLSPRELAEAPVGEH